MYNEYENDNSNMTNNNENASQADAAAEGLNNRTQSQENLENTERHHAEGESRPEGQDKEGQQEGHNAGGPASGQRRTPPHRVAPMPYQPAPAKKKGIAGKIAGITAAALLFGTVSGGTMAGINMLYDHMTESAQTQAAEAQIQDEGEAVEETQSAAPQITESQEGTTGGSQANTLLSLDVSAIVEKAMPSVVAINNTMLYQSQTWFGSSQTYEIPSSGSGIIVGENDDELLIVTNNHVIENSKDLEVVFIDNESIPAAVKGTDAENDLAVIAVALKDIPADTRSQISVATLGDSDELKVGQGVIAIGNALGYGQSVTVGYVSALNREVKTEDNVAQNLLQTDAAINPGNSGGALLNMKGEVIGINAAKYSSTEVEGMGYAIPITKVQDIINELMTKKTRVEVAEDQQGYLGIMGRDIDDQTAEIFGMPRGVYVTQIIEGQAASQSDLHEKDIIVKFDGQSVRNMSDLQEMLTYYEAGTTVQLTVQSLEDGQYVERQVEITLGSRADMEE